MKETFGTYIRNLRETKGLPIRKVAFGLDMDQSSLSKYERGERLPPRESLPIFAKFFEVTEKDLLIRYLSDKVATLLEDEKVAEEVLEATKEKLRYLKSQKFQQGKFNF